MLILRRLLRAVAALNSLLLFTVPFYADGAETPSTGGESAGAIPRLKTPVRAWFQPQFLDTKPELYPKMTMVTSLTDPAVARGLSQRGVTALRWCYGPNSEWSEGKSDYYLRQCDPLDSKASYQFAGVGIDEWDTGNPLYSREKDLASAGYRAARLRWPDSLMASFVTRPDAAFTGLVKDGTLDLAIVEGYSFIPNVGGLTLDGICERCDGMKAAGLLDRTIVCLGYISATKDSHGRHMTIAELERQMRHLKTRYPEMPGVAFYGFRDDAPETVELIRKADALAAELYPSPAPGPWYDRVITGMEVGPTGAHFGYSDPGDIRFAARFDGAEIVRRAMAAHSEYLVMWARDGDYAYYNSKLLPKAPGLGSRDPLREAVDEAAKHRLPVIAYCVVQQGGHFLKAHPEWEMRGPDGKPLGRFCYNSGYLEAMKQLVAEQLSYGIAGFHIDMLDQGFGPPYGCWCDTCRAQFQKEHGHQMPAGPSWDEGWDRMLEFRYRSSERFEKELAAHIRSLNPKATVDFNYHGNPPFSFEVGQRPVQHAGNGDFITGETGAWGFSALTIGLNAAFYQAAVPHQRVQVAMQRGVRMYHDQTTRPLADIRWELLTLLSHGAFVTMVDKTGFDGSLDPLAYERTGAAFAEARAKRSHFGHTPVADVGIYFSSRTRDWVGREKPAEWFQSFLGAHKALVYEHIPYGVVLDENATLESLRRFPVLLVPNAGIVNAGEVTLFRQYAEAGGKLILTGLAGCYDRMGRLTASSALEPLIGASFVQKLDSLDNWMRFDASGGSSGTNFAPNLRRDWPFLVKGPAAVWKPTTAATLGHLMKPWRSIRQQKGEEGTEWPMSAESRVGPAVLRNAVGAGEVLTFAGSPDFAAASEHHVVETRRLLASAVHLLHPAPRVRLTAPANVETVVTDDPATRTLRIHLLGYNSPPQTMPVKERPYVLPALMEDAPVFRATIELRDPVQSVAALSPATVLKQEGRRMEVTVNDVHEVVIVQY